MNDKNKILELIKNNIDQIPPLPDSIMKINKVASDEEKSLMDLAKEIKKDPIASARILTEARSAYYGFKNITTVEKAVSQFGREVSKAIAIDSIAKDSFDIDMSAYGITNSTFLSISQKRAFLMMKWFSRVDFKSLKQLALSSMLGNIGQILLSNIIKKLELENEFKESINTLIDVSVAEEEVLGINTLKTTALILKKWGFDEELIELIKNSHQEYIDLNDDEVDKKILANYAVYAIVDDTSNNINYEIPDSIKYTLKEHNLNLSLLEDAVRQIRD
jgi:HD-like signal output (HDOD) protein